MITCLAYVPIAPREKALALARRLVEARLVACANLLGPIQSTYRWNGAVESGEEFALLLKTTDARRADVERFFEAEHPYALHGIVWTTPDRVNAPFEKWIAESVS